MNGTTALRDISYFPLRYSYFQIVTIFYLCIYIYRIMRIRLSLYSLIQRARHNEISCKLFLDLLSYGFVSFLLSLYIYIYFSLYFIFFLGGLRMDRTEHQTRIRCGHRCSSGFGRGEADSSNRRRRKGKQIYLMPAINNYCRFKFLFLYIFTFLHFYI